MIHSLTQQLETRKNEDSEAAYPLRDDRYDNPSGKTGHKEKHIEKDKVLVKFWMM